MYHVIKYVLTILETHYKQEATFWISHKITLKIPYGDFKTLFKSYKFSFTTV